MKRRTSKLTTDKVKKLINATADFHIHIRILNTSKLSLMLLQKILQLQPRLNYSMPDFFCTIREYYLRIILRLVETFSK